MTKETFFHVMEHFIKCTDSLKQNSALLLLDNTGTYFSIKTLNLARYNDVVIFTFPLHCTHKLQPSDVGICGPFKTQYNNAINSYLMSNPDSPTLYRIADFVKEALCKAAIPHNIIESFETTEIFPFNKNIFNESDFIIASVTKKADLSRINSISSLVTTPANICVNITEKEINTNKPNLKCTIDERSFSFFSSELSFRGPADIRGFLKVNQQKNKRKNKKRKGRCMIAINMDEIDKIMEHEKEQELKKNKTEERKGQR
ncbi:uncharacterized protein [Cardiocondyla obscurior]|uniref:uncharacterized protein n=1 Tax=Cardiocondyla obscurior TaxID=286306 RepID=UPI0039657383